MKKIHSNYSEKNFYFFNVNAVLIFLVILGHLLQPTAQNNEGLKSFINFLFLFIIPCFVFTTGYFSTKGVTLINTVSRFIAPVLVIQLFYYFLCYLLDVNLVLHPFPKSLVIPFYHLWYLLSLFFWAHVINVMNEKYLKAFIIFSFLLAIAAGCFNSIGFILSGSRTIYYFPFFLLGYHFKKKNLNVLLTPKRFQNYFYLLFGLIFFAGVSWCHTIPLGHLLGVVSYEKMGESKLTGMLIRSGLLIVNILIGIFFLKIIPSKKTFFTHFGGKTLSIYLFHFITFLLLLFFDVYNKIENIFLLCLILIVATVVSFWITSLPFFKKVIKKISSVARDLLKRIFIRHPIIRKPEFSTNNF